MRAVIQRVSRAQVTVDNELCGSIQSGLLILVAAAPADQQEDIEWLSGKIARLRIFDDENGLMNRSLQEAGGEILVVSQFTLFASTKKGNRPSFSRSAAPEVALPLYERFIAQLSAVTGRQVQSGRFGAHMLVSSTNDGPVTIIIDTANRE